SNVRSCSAPGVSSAAAGATGTRTIRSGSSSRRSTSPRPAHNPSRNTMNKLAAVLTTTPATSNRLSSKRNRRASRSPPFAMALLLSHRVRRRDPQDPEPVSNRLLHVGSEQQARGRQLAVVSENPSAIVVAVKLSGELHEKKDHPVRLEVQRRPLDGLGKL